jgi:hypothetical protein
MKEKKKVVRKEIRIPEETYKLYLYLGLLTGEKWTELCRTDMTEGLVKRLHDAGVLEKIKV